jgi:hypothetical protein
MASQAWICAARVRAGSSALGGVTGLGSTGLTDRGGDGGIGAGDVDFTGLGLIGVFSVVRLSGEGGRSVSQPAMITIDKTSRESV